MVAAAAIAGVRRARRQESSAEDRDIGAGLDKPGAAEHFVLLQVLRKDRIFDRPEEGRVNAHRRPTAASISGMLASMSPAPPTIMMPISASLMMRISRALS